MIVCDASFLVHFLMGEDNADTTNIISQASAVAAPALVDFEVLSAIRRGVILNKSSGQRARWAIADFYDIRIERYLMEPFAERIWALKANATVYDASYLALAESLRAPLYTRDKRLASVPAQAVVITP